MSAVAKTLVPNKSWIVENDGIKLGTLNKEKKGFSFYHKGIKLEIRDMGEIKRKIGLTQIDELLQKQTKKVNKDIPVDLSVYDFPTATKPFNPVYNIVKKLPIYAKSNKSKSLYCAGYYIIKFRKGWVKSFCPKLITLERYPYQGPYKTETEMRTALTITNKQ